MTWHRRGCKEVELAKTQLMLTDTQSVQLACHVIATSLGSNQTGAEKSLERKDVLPYF